MDTSPEPPGPQPELPPEALDASTRLAERGEKLLRWAGVDQGDIDALRGDRDRSDGEWTRFSKAVVDNQFPSMGMTGAKKQSGRDMIDASRSSMHACFKFAEAGDDSNPRLCAYRYEYFKSLYDEEKRNLSLEEKQLYKPEQEKLALSKLGQDQEKVRETLEHDLQRVRADGAQEVEVSLDRPTDEIVSSVRDQADQIGMGHELSTAYHSRKHQRDLPPEERQGEAVDDYLSSARKTLKEGEVTSAERLEDGGMKLTFERTLQQGQAKSKTGTASTASPDGEQPTASRTQAPVWIRGHTGAVMSTYGRMNQNQRSRGKG